MPDRRLSIGQKGKKTLCALRLCGKSKKGISQKVMLDGRDPSVMARSFRKYLFWILLGFLLAGCNQSPSCPPFDPHIQGLKLVKLITGHDAIKDINQLHGRSINVVRGFIAHYEGAHDKAVIWASEASSQKFAQKQIAVMIQKMKSNRRSPFSHYRTLDVKGLRVIAFDGMGQVHYVFRDNAWAYWISADAKRMDMILKHVQRSR